MQFPQLISDKDNFMKNLANDELWEVTAFTPAKMISELKQIGAEKSLYFYPYTTSLVHMITKSGFYWLKVPNA